MARKRRENKEYWDKKKRSRPQEAKPEEREKLTATQSRPQQGLRLHSQTLRGQLSLMEASNGMLVQVPEEKMNDWLEAQQSEADAPLNSGELQLLDKVLEMLYGKEEK